MLTVACPHCGAPAPGALATPDWLGCHHCGYAGPPSPEVAQHLRAASVVLFQLDERER